MSLQQTLINHIQEKYLKNQIPANFDADYDLIDNNIMDSLAMIGLVSFLENEYGIEFGDQDFVPENFQSIHAIANFVEQKQKTA